MVGSVTGIEEEVFAALSHGERRKVLRIVGASKQGISYSEILSASALSTGSLNYHLKEMEGFIEKNDRMYQLSSLGKKSLTVLMFISGEAILDAPLSLEAVKSRRERMAEIILMPVIVVTTIFMAVIIGFGIYDIPQHGLHPTVAIFIVLELVYIYSVIRWRLKILQRFAMVLEYVEDMVFSNKRIRYT
ncbi:MAG: helix-turn-helix domain-containing protein [Candidatus Bathyarchaeota archaeon]|nr:helix-turn-helix domain-containing protein [Candidatus Bathyarchaeota archaeon]